MSEPELDLMLLELRAKAPTAPQELRERVRALPEPSSRRAWRVRPAFAAAVAIAVALGLGAALIGGITSSPPQKQSVGKFKSASSQLRGRRETQRQAFSAAPRTPVVGGFLQSTTASLDAL